MTRWKEVSGANERTAEMEPIGVIDIGSNSVRLVVYEGAVRAPTPVFNEKVLCGLGRSVASTGSLSVLVPASLPRGTYFLLACADQAAAVVEGSETNNCRTATTSVSVR